MASGQASVSTVASGGNEGKQSHTQVTAPLGPSLTRVYYYAGSKTFYVVNHARRGRRRAGRPAVFVETRVR